MLLLSEITSDFYFFLPSDARIVGTIAFGISNENPR